MVTPQELDQAAHAANNPQTIVKKGWMKGNFRLASVRQYRHEVRAILTGKPGYTQAEQEALMTEAINTLEEGVAYSQKRDFNAHQAAKAAAKAAYEAVLAQYHVENPIDSHDFDEEESYSF